MISRLPKKSVCGVAENGELRRGAFSAHSIPRRCRNAVQFLGPAGILTCLLIGLVAPMRVVAAEPSEPSPGLLSALGDGFSFHLRAVGDLSRRLPIRSDFNPDNEIARLPATEYEFELRPNLNLERPHLRLMAKPRFRSRYAQWHDGALDGTSDSTSETTLNEWLARIQIHEKLYLSYGRENLQWGPAYSLSPSNPFFFDNGRGHPKREIGGRDFFKAVYLPGSSWTVSLIGNTALGRDEAVREPFEPIYALKADYTGTNHQLGLIGSDERERRRLGGYGQWTASDALLMYAEWTASRGTDALYPQETNNPVGWQLAGLKSDSTRILGTALIGGSYTLELGPTLTVEYIYNTEGYNEAEADRYFQLAEDASALFRNLGPAAPLAAATLGQALNPGLRLLRRHYLFLQFLQTEIRDQWDLTLRYTQNLEDGSGSFVPYVEWSLNDRLQLFALGVVNLGGPSTEFGRLFRYQAAAGFEILFR